MGIKKVQGTTRPVDYTKDRQPNVKNPMLLIYADGRAQMSVRCKDLLAITAVTTQSLMDRVPAVAEGVKDPEFRAKGGGAAVW